MTQRVIGGILLAIIAALLLIFPKALWRLTERWKSKGTTEPSRTFLWIVRIVGAALLTAGMLVAAGILK